MKIEHLNFIPNFSTLADSGVLDLGNFTPICNQDNSLTWDKSGAAIKRLGAFLRVQSNCRECPLGVVSCPTAARVLADRSALDSSRSD
jgi:hypothetical protein